MLLQNVGQIYRKLLPMLYEKIIYRKYRSSNESAKGCKRYQYKVSRDLNE